MEKKTENALKHETLFFMSEKLCLYLNRQYPIVLGMLSLIQTLVKKAFMGVLVVAPWVENPI